MKVKDKFVGNKKTHIYHLKDCHCVKQIAIDHIRSVGSDCLDEDENSYRACAKCFKNNVFETDL